MKAKRIISLLLTVAMIAACGVTAFAAPTGYSDYTQTSTTAFNGLDSASIYGVLPNTSEIRADFDVVNMTDADFLEAMGVTPAEAAAEAGITIPATWTDSTYLITVSLHNLGTLVSNGAKKLTKYNYGGFKICVVNIDLKGDENVLVYGMLDGVLNSGNDGQDEHNYYYQYNDTTAAGGYPAGETSHVTTPLTIEDASIENALQIMVFAKAGAEIDITKANVSYQNIKEGTINVDTNGTAAKQASVALWHPATVTLGEAEGGDDPVVNPGVGAVTGGTTGVDFEDGSDSYDNAFEVSASFSNADAITAAGVLFIPAAYYAGEELNALTEDVAIAEYVGNAAGEGTLTIRAAIKGIPRGLVGKHNTVEMRVMPYLRVNDAYTYGDEATKTINVTEIAPKA